MNRYKINILLLSAIIGFAYAKDSYTISGIVQNESGETLKKGSVILVNKTDGAEIKKTKISKKGKFKLKKIATGKYQINVDADGKGSLPVNVMDDDVKDLVVIIKKDNKVDQPEETAPITTLDPEETQTLETPLKTKKEEDLLPQVRAFDQVDKLQFEDQFFEYESNLRVL